VEKVGIVGKAKILVAQVELSHRRLGEVMYAFGKGKVGEAPALIVATEDESGGKMTIRFGERG
jgi:hypothetical protein